MTNEEMERTMQFILEHQAQFAANRQQADERLTRIEGAVAGLAANQQQTNERVARLETNMAGLAANQQQTNERVARLETSMDNMARAQAHMYEVVAAMVDGHKHTEQRLDAFIGVLERYIAEGRDGRAGGEGSV